MDYTQIRYEVDDQVLTITLNRPQLLNALTDFVMVPELLDALDRADEDDDVRVIIVTGAGRGFCAGHDLNEGFDYDEQASATIDDHRDPGGVLSLRIYNLKKPIIAAINGCAIGVGVTMTLPMDIRLASDHARFGFVFARVGITLEACSSWFLPRIVGPGKAQEWACTGRIFDASEALSTGLVSEVVEPGLLLRRAREIASEIVNSTSMVSVLLNRQLIWRMLGASHPMAAHRIESKCIYTLGKQSDAEEAVAAFHENRPPRFRSKPGSHTPEFYPWWSD